MADETKALAPSKGQSTSAGLAAFVGSLPDRVMAFDQIAMSIAASQAFPGYDSVQKVKAACWAADALAVHPVAYLSGVYAANMGGKLVMIPKVAFEDGLLRARLPGYDYTVLEENEKACEIEFFAEGRRPQRVRYTIEQAQRAGLTSKDVYKNYPDKMLFARCFHMGAHRIGPHILAGLPDPADYDATPVTARPDREPSAAEVLEEAATPVLKPEEPAPIVDWYAALSGVLRKLFGRLTKDQLLAKASTVWAAICKERGVDVPQPFAKAKDFGPVEAQEMVVWLRRKYPDGKAAVEGKADSGPTTHQGEAGVAASDDSALESASVSTAEVADEAPPMADSDDDSKIESLYLLAKAAKKSHPGRAFVMESPRGTKTFWFVDKEILTARGHTQSVMLQKDGEQRVAEGECRLLCRMMREVGVAVA